jgi:hypothetical protein
MREDTHEETIARLEAADAEVERLKAENRARLPQPDSRQIIKENEGLRAELRTLRDEIETCGDCGASRVVGEGCGRCLESVYTTHMDCIAELEAKAEGLECVIQRATLADVLTVEKNEQLRAALRNAEHGGDCAARHPAPSSTHYGVCDCGRDAALGVG